MDKQKQKQKKLELEANIGRLALDREQSSIRIQQIDGEIAKTKQELYRLKTDEKNSN